MIFKTILILMINFTEIYKLNHITDLKWNNRVLVIRDNDKIDLPIKINPFIEEFNERDFIIVFAKNQNTFIQNRIMSVNFSNSIYKKIQNIDSNQYFILIGKDGQVKKSYTSETEIEKIFSDVDKMPMRKYEMITRKK